MLRLWRSAGAEGQLHSVQHEDRAATEADARPGSPLYAVDPEFLCGVGLSWGVEFYPVLDVMPHAERHGRLRVRLGSVTEPAVARHAIRLACHRRVVGVEVGRRLATGRCTHDRRVEEIRPVRALSGLPECGPLIVRARAIEGDQ